ncbi:hypothetical protein Emag_004568 [Eimeria magna]
MGILLPEIPEIPQRSAGPSESFSRRFQVPEHRRLVHAGTFVIETKGQQPRSRTPSRAESWKLPAESGYQCFLNCGSKPSRCGTPARDTTHSGSASALSDTWPAADVYEYNRFPSSQPPQEAPSYDFEGGRTIATPSSDRELKSGASQETTFPRPAEEEEAGESSRQGKEKQATSWFSGEDAPSTPANAEPSDLQPILTRSIGLTEHATPHASGRVYGGIEGSKDPRDLTRTMFHPKSLASLRPRGPKEVVDTLVPKTTIEERLKFVDLQYAQEVEKFVEVPEVYYNDIIVEVPQVVEVIKVVPREEVRENITYVPRFETKYIPKYVEVPIIKIVDRYEEVDEIHEVLRPVPQKSVVDHEDVPFYKRKLEPKIIKEELINQKPHFIDIPVPFEQSVITHVDQPYFMNRYRDHVYPVPTAHRVTPVFRQGNHEQMVDVPVPSPYLVTHTAHGYSPPALNYQVGAAHLQGYTMQSNLHAPFQHPTQMAYYQGAVDRRQLPGQLGVAASLPYDASTSTSSNAFGCPSSCPPMSSPDSETSGSPPNKMDFLSSTKSSQTLVSLLRRVKTYKAPNDGGLGYRVEAATHRFRSYVELREGAVPPEQDSVPVFFLYLSSSI